jgi:hypothetical protein
MFAVLAATLVAAVGCGSSSAGGSSAKQADIDAVVSQLSSNGAVISHKQALCIAQRAVPNLSAKGLKVAKKGSSDVSDLSKIDEQAIFDGVSACVTTADLSPSLEKALESGDNKVDAATAKCFVKKVDAAYPKSGDLMKMMNSSSSSKVSQLMSGCMSSGSVKDRLVKDLTGTGSFTTAQATCVVDKLLAEVPASQLTDTSGSLSADAQSKLTAAATACAGSS